MNLRIAAALLLLPILMPACDRGESGPEPQRAERQKITVSTLPFLSFGPLFIAQEEGYFAEQGLDVEFVDLRRTQFGIPALIKGQLDVLAGGMTSGMLNSIARGGEVRIVADRCHVGQEGQECTWFGALARSELVKDGAIKTDPEGLDVATPLDVVHGMMLHRLLPQLDLTLEDINIRFVQYPALPEAMATGSTDLVIVGEPWLTRIMDASDATLLAAGEDVVPAGQVGTICFGPRLLRERRDLGKRFMIANLKGVRQYNRGKTDRNLDILSRRTGLDRKLLTRLCWPNLRGDGMLNVEAVHAFQQWAKDENLLDRKLKTVEFWEPFFVRQAHRVIGQTGQGKGSQKEPEGN